MGAEEGHRYVVCDGYTFWRKDQESAREDLVCQGYLRHFAQHNFPNLADKISQQTSARGKPCAECLGHAVWLEHRAGSSPSGEAPVPPLSSDGSPTVAAFMRPAMYCRGLNQPAFPEKNSFAGLQPAQRAVRQKYQLINADAVVARFDPETAASFPVRMLAVSCKVVNTLVRFSGTAMEAVMSPPSLAGGMTGSSRDGSGSVGKS